MFYSDIFFNPVAIFLTGLYISLLRVCYGTTAQLLIVPLLTIFGLPPLFAVGTTIAANFCVSSITAFKTKLLTYAHKRLGLSLGLFGIIGAILGHSLLKNIPGFIFMLGYILILSIAGIIFLYYSLSGKKDLPVRLASLFSWPFPGWHKAGKINFIEFISLHTVAIIGLSIGFSVGFWGFGAGLLGAILLVNILKAPSTVAIATDFIASSIIAVTALSIFILNGEVELFSFLILIAGAFLGNYAGNLAPPKVKTGLLVSPGFGILLLSAPAALVLKMLGYYKIAGLLLFGGVVLLCIIILITYPITNMLSKQKKSTNFTPEPEENQTFQKIV